MSPHIHTGAVGLRGNDNAHRQGRGGKGGTGQAVNFGYPLVSILEGRKRAVRGLRDTMNEFCCHYRLGEEIPRLLQIHHFNSPGSLLHVTDVKLLKIGFKIGHIAELKWALRKMVGKEVDEGGGCRPEVYGGIGGRGGHGGERGGGGGIGEDSVFPHTHGSLFAKIWGGIGGEGGSAGLQDLRTPQGLDDAAFLARYRRMLPFLPNTNSEETWIIGGIGGMGGTGDYKGGEGGVGEGSHISTGHVSFFTKIFGGIGGEGGTGGCVGGTGGTGRGSAVHELLGCADQKTRSAKPTLLSSLRINGDLYKRLLQQGFVTVGALFMVTGEDLLNLDGFELGDICILKEALENFQLG